MENTHITLKIDTLTANPNNARVHPPEQIANLVQAITQFGFKSRIIVDENHVILAGHGRVIAAAQMGMEEVPAIRVEGWSENDKRAFMLSDNRVALLAEWDMQVLLKELQDVTEMGLNLKDVGLNTPMIDNLMEMSITGSVEASEMSMSLGSGDEVFKQTNNPSVLADKDNEVQWVSWSGIKVPVSKAVHKRFIKEAQSHFANNGTTVGFVSLLLEN